MLGLEPAHGPDVHREPLRRGLVGQCLFGRSEHGAEDLVHHRPDEELLGREAPVEGSHPHAGPVGDDLHAHVGPLLVEGRPRRRQDLDPVAGGVPPERGPTGTHDSAMVPPATMASSALRRWSPWSSWADSEVAVGMKMAAITATSVITARKANPRV